VARGSGAFVLDGLVAVTIEGEDLSVGQEEFVLVPRGTAHTGRETV
jgi:mannose-6-phosphate isomerase-like protein (cupin superfamily)